MGDTSVLPSNPEKRELGFCEACGILAAPIITALCIACEQSRTERKGRPVNKRTNGKTANHKKPSTPTKKLALTAELLPDLTYGIGVYVKWDADDQTFCMWTHDVNDAINLCHVMGRQAVANPATVRNFPTLDPEATRKQGCLPPMRHWMRGTRSY